MSRYPSAKELFDPAKVIKSASGDELKVTFSGQPGDIMVFKVGHVGIYLGNGLYVSSTTEDDLHLPAQDKNFSVVIKRPIGLYILRRIHRKTKKKTTGGGP